jgi:hypothetical protein
VTHRPSTSRRAFLRRGGAALAAAASAGLAGCSDAVPSLGSGSSAGGDLPAYATWFPAPELLLTGPATDGEDGYSMWYPLEVRRFDELAAYYADGGGSFEPEQLYQDGTAHPVLDIEPREAGTEVSNSRGMAVLETGRDEADVVGAFEAYDDPTGTFEVAGEYEEFTMLSFTGAEWVVGVDGGTVVEAFTMSSLPFVGDKRAAVEAIIDARAGENRYVDADELLDGLVRRLGAGMRVFVHPPTPEPTDTNETEKASEPVAWGTAYTATTARNARYVAAFETGTAAAADEAGGAEHPTAGWSDRSVTRDGRWVVVTGTASVG